MFSKQQLGILGGIVLVLVIGASYFVYADRPVMDLKNDLAQNSGDQITPTTNDASDDSSENDSDSDDVSDDDDSNDQSASNDQVAPTDSGASSSTTDTLSFTMAEVTSHGTDSSCWSAVNGSVYDLTEWIGRHPGGAEAIKKICGKDGSELFNKKHGTFTKAIDALALLKIGTLM